MTQSQQPSQCAFIARYQWLKEQLAFDDRRLPRLTCERFQTWYEELHPEAISLIFPSAYMNNPASMFGHTFLRIDRKGQTESTRILAYTINYAARVPADAGLEYVFKGVFGGYHGYFSTVPYYMKVQEYRDIDNRDIWEYSLRFNPGQIRALLMHTWELGSGYFDYYFFKENCAYHILSLLEVADPTLHLTDQFVFWTIPVDTIRLVTGQNHLVKDITFRPSRSTQVKRKRESLTSAEEGLAESADPRCLIRADIGISEPFHRPTGLSVWIWRRIISNTNFLPGDPSAHDTQSLIPFSFDQQRSELKTSFRRLFHSAIYRVS